MSKRDPGGGLAMSGAVVARKLDPAALAAAERAVGQMEAQVTMSARYADERVTGRIAVSVPYGDGERRSTMTTEFDAETAAAFEQVFRDALGRLLPAAVREARRGAARSLLAAEQRGELD